MKRDIPSADKGDFD